MSGTTHLVQFSTGVASAEIAWRLAGEHGSAITQLDGGDKWDDLDAKVAAHVAEHGCGGAS